MRVTREDSKVDLTPMVDVTFLLLIFFVATATYSLQKALVAPVPTAKAGKVQTSPLQQELTIHVDEYNSYVLTLDDEEREAASEHELYRQVRRICNDATPDRLVVVANDEAQHGKVVTALDAGMSVGISNVSYVME